MIHEFSLSTAKLYINNLNQMNVTVPGSPKAQSELRKRIREIHNDDTLEPHEKARRVQKIMNSQCRSDKDGSISEYNRTYHVRLQATNNPKVYLTSVTLQDKSKGILGCKHYQRKVKLQADCCKQIFSCHYCHDESSDHAIVRQQTKTMLCMQCLTLQSAAQFCGHCGIKASQYYCDKCKLWDNDETKSIYHCDACGICRRGRGLNDDFFHCDICNVCMTITMKNNHRCIERSLESDCPVCGEYMFTSRITVNFMPCGHSIHQPCFLAYSQSSYQCPICLKSFKDMTQYFKQLDDNLRHQTMPPEYKNRISLILCNDCEQRSEVPYHFFYHKCQHCTSYNTTVLSVKAHSQD